MSYNAMGAYHTVYPGQPIVEAAAGFGGYAVGARAIPPGIHQPPDPAYGRQTAIGSDCPAPYACGIGRGTCPPAYSGPAWPSCSYSGFGAVGGFAATFNPASIWNDIQTSNVCYSPQGVEYHACQANAPSCPRGMCNAASQRAVSAIAKGLNQLGYGELPENGSGVQAVAAAFKQFLSDHHLTAGPGFGFTQDGLAMMKQKLVSGDTPGPGDPIHYDDKGLPTDTGTSKAGLGTMLLVGLLVAGGVAAVAIAAKKKNATHTTYQYAANSGW